jgi:hypothetical protein
MVDSPGPVVEGTVLRLGTDLDQSMGISPVYYVGVGNAVTFLLLHVQRYGDIRQAVEFSAALKTAGTDVALQFLKGKRLMGT